MSFMVIIIVFCCRPGCIFRFFLVYLRAYIEGAHSLLPASKRLSQLKNTYDASKEASDQQLEVGVPSVSIKLNFISNTDKQSTPQESSRVKNTAQSLRQIEQK